MQQFQKALADAFRIRGQFRKDDGGGVGVLVPHEVLGQVAVAFLPAEDKVTAVFQTQGARLFFTHLAVALPFSAGMACSYLPSFWAIYLNPVRTLTTS